MSAQALAQGTAVTTKRATELRDGPSDSARNLIDLPAQTSLTREAERSGPWMRVKTGTGVLGWVHMFDLGSANGSSGNFATGFLRGVTSLFNKGGTQGQGTVVATSTVGIRGLGKNDLALSQPDTEEMTHMETLAVNTDDARQFASSVELQSRNVPTLTPAATPAGNKNPAREGTQ
jgi:hypothetical protein